MPYSKDNPPARIKKLPKHAQSIWISAYNSAIKQYDGNEERANKVAWDAVKNKYKKVGDKWVKKMDEMRYLSMAISKIAKRQGVMHFETTASDDQWDSDDERLTIELFEDFIRQEEEEKAKLGEEYIPPYLSISHYRMPIGDVNEQWIQGNRFKTRGIFYDDKFGRALFKAILEERASGEEVEEPIKISIGFWPHEARDEGGRIAYTKGKFDHEASTRVPINVRATFDEVIEKSMTTKKEDAASMIGEELAIELDDDERSRMEKGDLEDGMVIKAEDEESPLTLLQEEVLKSLLEEEGRDSEVIEKAVWDYAYKKALPDSAYLWVEKGEGCAKKDGKTPQKCRHLPYKDKSGGIDCGHLRAAIQAVGGARTGKPMSVPSGVLSKAKRLYASKCKKKGKGLVSVGSPDVTMEYRPYGGATSIGDAVAYMESQEVVWDMRDDLHLFSEVVENILKSPEVEDKKAAIKKAVNELDKVLGEDLMKDKETKSSVLDLMEGIKEPDATEEKGDQVVEPAPEEESSLDALFGVLKSVVHNKDLDRAGKIASAFECLKTIGAACDKIITETTPRTEADIVAEITEAASKAAVDRVIEAIKPLAEKVTLLEATLRNPSVEPERKGLVFTEKAGVRGDEPVKKGSVKWYAMFNSGLDPETGKPIF